MESPIPDLLQCFVFGLDKGPENLGFAPKLIAEIQHVDNICAAINFCFPHQFRLVAEDQLEHLDSWKWGDADGDDAYAFGGKYTGCVKTISNTWRSPGTHMKLRRTVTDIFGDEVADTFFRKLYLGHLEVGG